MKRKHTYILGVNGRSIRHSGRSRGHGGNHNAAACLLKDGKLISFVEEERFTHVKHYGGFPVESIKYCLKHAGITLNDVDHIAVGWKSFKNIFLDRFTHFIKTGLVFRVPMYCAGMCWFAFQDWMAGDIPGAFKKYFKKDVSKKLTFIDHHLAHAASSYRASGWKNATVVNFDGAGETTATWLGKGEKGKISNLKEFKLPDSLGFCYSAFTEYLGFIKNNDEYKVMGLASYGKPSKKVDDIMKKTKNGYKIDVGAVYHFSLLKKKYVYNKFIRRYGDERPNDDAPITQRHKDIAASIQNQLDDVGTHLVKQAMEFSGSKRVCLSGGVALNCKMSQRIRERLRIKEMFIQPAAADMGVALGAALERASQLGISEGFEMKHVYYGPEYTEKEMIKALKKAKFPYKRVKNISKTVAKYIHENNVIGWFQGRLEAGPRALGNRSILANPCTPGMDDVVNVKIKFREKWRPFCPSLIYEARHKYFEEAVEAPYMIITFNVKKAVQKYIPSIVHIDGTARPQTVRRTTNKKYYDVINEFGKLSGHPIVMNTSFNIKGDTIVNTPEDAIRTFLKTDMDILALGPFIVEKTDLAK